MVFARQCTNGRNTDVRGRAEEGSFLGRAVQQKMNLICKSGINYLKIPTFIKKER